MALPNDTTRLGDELSLVITDIVVELEDGTLANIEVQKLGYYFTGERASCYSADLLLRQYKRIRDEKKEKFRYKDINPVYTIVLMENSPEEFHKFNDLYVHTFETISDTGLELKMLQNFIFIPVDIFLEKLHNKGIGNKLDAWLTFLGCDEPEYIVDLITAYPKFKPMYANLYDLCLNVERMMGMFSKELEILDRNTVKFMIDDMQEQAEKKIAEAEKQAAEAEKQAAEVEKRLEEVNKKAQEANNIIAEKDKTITELLKKLSKYENNSDSDK